MLGTLGLPELLLILAIIVLIFGGGKKIPEIFKGVGKGIKGFKKEMKDEDEDDNNKELKDK